MKNSESIPDTHASQQPSKRNRSLRAALILGAALAIAGVQSARAITNSLPFYEPFAYTNEQEELGQFASGTNWSIGNSLSSSCARLSTNAALSYLGLQTDTNSEGLEARYGYPGTTPGTSTKNRGAPFTAQTSGSVYLSFLLSYRIATNTTTMAIIGLGNSGNPASGSNPGPGATLWVDSSGRLLITKNNNATIPTSPVSAPLVISNTYLVVMRYTFNTTSTTDDEVDLWVNPLPFGDNSTVPAPTLSTTTGTDINMLQNVAYFQISGPPGVFIDEIRVATDWASVTPKSCPPGSLFTVTGGGAICGGGQFDIGLSGSEVGVDYWLMTNGVYDETIPGTGSPLDFGLQNVTAQYNVIGSNTTTGCVGWMNGSATVSILNEPNITVQPVNQNPVSGSLVAMSVQATGDGLTYQWQRNGTNISDGGEFSGTTNSTLLINPVGPADATAGTSDGYDVVVSGTCPPAQMSTKVSLILSGGANLTWYGDGGSNFWDIATSPNWNTGTAVFNSGDNVTFDTTAPNTTVNLDSPYLNPHTVTVSTGAAYTWIGSGMITGATTTVTIDGMLTLNSINTYGGGTTLGGGGIVSILTGTSFGSGTLNIGNSTLSVSNATTLPNPVIISGPAVMLADNSSSAAIQLNGSVTGSSGSLTIANNTVPNQNLNNQPRITLAGTNFTFSLPIILDNLDYAPAGPGLQTSSNFFLALGNTSGEQIFNGAISSIGNGQVQRRGAGGNSQLNAQSTYGGDTLLRLGGLGFGANSTPTVGTVITSGPIGVSNLFLDGAGAMSVYAVGAARTIANPIFYITNTASTLDFIGSNTLTFTGPVDLFGTTQTIQVDNTNGDSIFAGPLGNAVNPGNGGGIAKIGFGALTLDATNTYTGPTLVLAGSLIVNGDSGPTTVTVSNTATLGGTGTVSGPTTIQAGGTIEPGTAGTGTLTVNNSLTIQGNVAVAVNNSATPSSGKISVSGALSNTGTGSVVVTDVGPPLAIGDKFTLFNGPVTGGAAMSVTGGGNGVTWANNLAVDGSITVTSAGGPTPHPVVTTVFANGGNLIFGGTNGVQGNPYYVLTSTNLAIPLSNWTALSTGAFGAGGVFSVTNPIVTGTPARFYLLQVP